MSQGPLVYVICPACGKGISEPFVRTSGPVAFTHRVGPRTCRLVVVPDPAGDDHRTYRVPAGVTLEHALLAYLRDPALPKAA